MTALDSLLRVQRWAIQERRQSLTDLEALAERCRQDLFALEKQGIRAQDSAVEPVAGTAAQRAASPVIQARCEKLRSTLGELERQADELRAELQEAIKEVEEVEQASQHQGKRGSALRRKRESHVRDELNSGFYQTRGRKQAGER